MRSEVRVPSSLSVVSRMVARFPRAGRSSNVSATARPPRPPGGDCCPPASGVEPAIDAASRHANIERRTMGTTPLHHGRSAFFAHPNPPKKVYKVLTRRLQQLGSTRKVLHGRNAAHGSVDRRRANPRQRL